MSDLHPTSEEAKPRDFVAGLRALADWYEAHPDMPPPHPDPLSVYALEGKEDCARAVAALGSCKKEYGEGLVGEGLFCLLRDFGGGVSLRFVFSRQSVCRKKVVGLKQVPERLIPAHEEEIVEWECEEPILAEGR